MEVGYCQIRSQLSYINMVIGHNACTYIITTVYVTVPAKTGHVRTW